MIKTQILDPVLKTYVTLAYFDMLGLVRQEEHPAPVKNY